MRRIIADVKAFGLQYIRSRVGAFFALIFPIILILLFGAIFGQSGSSAVQLYVQDLDNTPASHAFVTALNNTTVVAYHAIPRDAAISDYIRAHLINTALLIPAGFQETVARARAGDPTASVNLTLYGDPTQSSYGIALAAVNGATTQFNFQIVGARPVVLTHSQTVTTRSVKFIDLFLPGIIGFTVLTSSLFGMTNITADYRTRKFFKFLATTTLRKSEWLLSKFIFYALLMIVSVIFMAVVSFLVFHGSPVITPLAVLLVLAGTLEFTSLGMILGLFVRDTQTAETLANAIGFPMMFLAGSFFPIDSFPPFLQGVARVLPLTYVNEGLRATMVFGNDGTAMTYLLITLALAIVFFVIPARALSWRSK